MTSGADIAIAVGTIGAALVAAAGLVVSLLINNRDRARADTQAQDDRQAAVALAAADRASVREDLQRRHIVELLLELGREVGRQQAYAGAPQSADATQQIILLLSALPAECAHTVREKFGVTRTYQWPGGLGQKLNYLNLNAVGGTADTAQMTREIAYDIDRYMTAGLPPDRVWSDMQEQSQWQRARWPNH